MAAKTGYKRLARIYQRKHNRKANVNRVARLFWLNDLDTVSLHMGKRGFWNKVPGLYNNPYEQEPKLDQCVKRRINNKIKNRKHIYASS